MDNHCDETIERITARYVAEYQAGRQPKLSDYIQHYPGYADAIAGFVSYYHLIEAPSSPETALHSPAAELTDVSRNALSRLYQRLERNNGNARSPVPLRAERMRHLKVAEKPAPFQSERKEKE
jgi:hypothetical protein